MDGRLHRPASGAGFLLDGEVARRWPRLASSGRGHADTEEKLVRLAVGAYLLLLWNKGAVALWERGDAILTPEPMADAAWMGAAQFAVASVVAWCPACILAAAGTAILYGYGIAQFGVFHMTDYVFFPGIAAGFPMGFVTVVAGFVEFTLAFYFMTGWGLVRLGTAAYAAIFFVAIPEFRHLDSVGHLPIVAIPAVVCLRGASPLPRPLRVPQHAGIIQAGSIAAFYLVSLTGFVAMYYGLHWAEYG